MSENVEDGNRRIHRKRLTGKNAGLKITFNLEPVIRKRAYELSLLNPNATELENWLQAEKEIKKIVKNINNNVL